MNIAQTLKQARRNAELTLREVARLVDSSEAQVHHWESGRTTPRGDVLARYAEAGLITLTANNDGPLPATNTQRPATQTA